MIVYLLQPPKFETWFLIAKTFIIVSVFACVTTFAAMEFLEQIVMPSYLAYSIPAICHKLNFCAASLQL